VNPFGNPQKLMKQFQQMQERMQEEITTLEVEASSGGGMVRLVMDGSKNIKSLKIDPQVVNREDLEMLQDLIVAAINQGNQKVEEALQEKLGGMAGGLKIPGLF
jgi:nucleoid-associated protein EbfC